MTKRKCALQQGRGSKQWANDVDIRLPSFTTLLQILWLVHDVIAPRVIPSQEQVEDILCMLDAHMPKSSRLAMSVLNEVQHGVGNTITSQGR